VIYEKKENIPAHAWWIRLSMAGSDIEGNICRTISRWPNSLASFMVSTTKGASAEFAVVIDEHGAEETRDAGETEEGPTEESPDDIDIGW
jgi:hypothetical protein